MRRDKHADNYSHAMWCAMSEHDDANTTRTNKKTTCTFTCQVSRFMCFVLVLVFHVVIGVGRLIVRFHHAHAIPSFLLDVVVRLCLVIVNSDCSHKSCMLHIAKTGSVRCCPCTSRGGEDQESTTCTKKNV